ncbi:DUF1102 domain-containing protein [Natronosalvus vescus]|uniref:DUF1102 domain-containing protein n=1 Tax=Natronosalvus vescus TaxID=2953881 RepID=UPI0020912479|nr:DUF1102 domain-containing protein [Natronosalvus vescus]
MGVGSASIGGSALLGTGAFSRVESNRSVTIAVAEDPDAYLGLDKCGGHDNPTPNGSYAHLDDNGHLELLMNEDNPTHNGEQAEYLGAGINSNSTTWFDNVFQICNQGKEDVCVWISDSESWPRVDEGQYEGERRVEFYLGDDDDRSLIGEENAYELGLGDCICVGLRVRSYDLVEADELLEDLENTIQINADVDGVCFERPPLPECPFYGTTMEDPTEIHEIRYDAASDEIVTETVGNIGNMSPHDIARPNGLAFDDENDVFYFAEDFEGTDGVLFTMNEDGNMGLEEYGDITTGGAGIAGAAFWDEMGEYLFIEEGGDELKAAKLDGVGGVDTRVVVDLDEDVAADIGLGDLAIDRDAATLYVSTASSDRGTTLFSIDLDDTDTQELITDGSDEDYATNKQLAFDDDGVLWAHHAWDGDWWTVDLETGAHNEDDPVANTQGYSDLARCGFIDGE